MACPMSASLHAARWGLAGLRLAPGPGTHWCLAPGGAGGAWAWAAGSVTGVQDRLGGRRIAGPRPCETPVA
eukprot:5420086-Prymnesium_polylepis.1